ncbi:dipeptide/oligopeptide/nickel ABC transporter permease/ATP-binding protein [Streptomyces sp. NPDC087850]|uniref:dipeptide/oligopeptide/nickel ABC transporter permease/ATP-binding protein n=1 Tax=Streptomyces sp. NPDC087850 TaxID=3365809 RepID=UPI00382E6488
MTPPTTDPGAGPAGEPAPGAVPHRDRVVRRLLRDPTAVTCLLVLLLIVLAGLCAPLLTSRDPAESSLTAALAPMSAEHPLGGDGVGRDVLARLVYGARTSLLGTALATFVAVAIGVPLGLVAGYFRGWFDRVASWSADLVMSLPAIILLLVVLGSFGQSTYLAMAVFGLLMAPGVFRLVRGSVAAVREELYVDAARVSGLADRRIICRHVLPVVQAPTIIQAANLLGIGILIQSGLEFLGLGSASEPSWGAMLNDAFGNIYTEPLLLLWPGLAIAVTVAASGLLGNALTDVLIGAGAKARGREPRRPAPDRPAAGGPAGATGPGPAPAARDALRGDELLVVEDLRVSYPVRDGESVVVDGVSLAVRKGEVLGLVGESGSGKSQTAFAVLGLLPPEARVGVGSLVFDGTDLTAGGGPSGKGIRGWRIAYVPQEPMSNLDPSFRIGSQLVEPMRRHLGLSRARAREKALALLDRVGIDDPARVYASYPHQVSGGMAQRVLIAAAVSCDPDLLIADEPTTALDVTVQAEVLDLMRSLQKERAMGMILVTHDFGVVADICDRVAVMRTGRIVESAPADELFADPRHPYTRMLLDATLEDGEPRRPPGSGAGDGATRKGTGA